MQRSRELNGSTSPVCTGLDYTKSVVLIKLGPRASRLLRSWKSGDSIPLIHWAEELKRNSFALASW